MTDDIHNRLWNIDVNLQSYASLPTNTKMQYLNNINSTREWLIGSVAAGRWQTHSRSRWACRFSG
jgi:hypothetical protein